MPFFKTHQPLEQFIKQFTDGTTPKTITGEGDRTFPMLPVTLFTGEVTDFLVRYYNRSGESSIEDVREYYPCIVIQDFIPEIDRTKLWDKDWLEGYYDEVSQTRDYITLPIPMIFKFQVSAVTKRQKEKAGVNDWFLEKFMCNDPKFFEFNKLQTDDGFVADITPYRVNTTEIPRMDGRFEYVYDFILETYIHAKSKSYIFVTDEDENPTGVSGGDFRDTLEKIKASLSMGNLKDLETVLQHEFELI